MSSRMRRALGRVSSCGGGRWRSRAVLLNSPIPTTAVSGLRRRGCLSSCKNCANFNAKQPNTDGWIAVCCRIDIRLLTIRTVRGSLIWCGVRRIPMRRHLRRSRCSPTLISGRCWRITVSWNVNFYVNWMLSNVNIHKLARLGLTVSWSPP